VIIEINQRKICILLVLITQALGETLTIRNQIISLAEKQSI